MRNISEKAEGFGTKPETAAPNKDTILFQQNSDSLTIKNDAEDKPQGRRADMQQELDGDTDEEDKKRQDTNTRNPEEQS